MTNTDDIRARLAACPIAWATTDETFKYIKHYRCDVQSLLDRIAELEVELTQEKELRQEWKATTGIAANLVLETSKELDAAQRRIAEFEAGLEEATDNLESCWQSALYAGDCERFRALLAPAKGGAA